MNIFIQLSCSQTTYTFLPARGFIANLRASSISSQIDVCKQNILIIHKCLSEKFYILIHSQFSFPPGEFTNGNETSKSNSSNQHHIKTSKSINTHFVATCTPLFLKNAFLNLFHHPFVLNIESSTNNNLFDSSLFRKSSSMNEFSL